MIVLSQTERDAHPVSHEIAEAANARLRASPYVSLRGLSCRCDDGGALFLQGRVPTFYLKQLVQETVADVEGVVQVVNKAEVVSSAASTAPSACDRRIGSAAASLHPT